MALQLAMVVDRLCWFFRTIWGLQERRFCCIFELVSSAAVSMTMALVVCFLSVRNHRHTSRGGELVLAFM